MNFNYSVEREAGYLFIKLAGEYDESASMTLVVSQKAIDKFTENVARNRGVDLMVFSDLEAATDWLNKNLYSA